MGKMDKLAWSGSNSYNLIPYNSFERFFSFDIFYVSTFRKVLCPFFNDDIYEMWLQYFWWNFGGSTIKYVIS